MSLDDTTTIDAIGVEKESGFVVLTIADSWNWGNIQGHLVSLGEKLNAYLEFIRSGEIYDSYPVAREREIVIDVIFRFPVPAAGSEFLEHAKTSLSQMGITLRHRIYAPPVN